MSLEPYTPVRLLSDAYALEGVRAGDIGYIVEALGGRYEVESSRADGSTIASLAIAEVDLEPAPEVEK